MRMKEAAWPSIGLGRLALAGALLGGALLGEAAAATVDHIAMVTAASSCHQGCQGWMKPFDSSRTIDSDPTTEWTSDTHWSPGAYEWFAFWFNAFHNTDYIKFTPRIYQGQPYGVPELVHIYYSANGVWNYLTTAYLPANIPNGGQLIPIPRVYANGFLLTTTTLRPGNWGEYNFQLAEVVAGINDCSEGTQDASWCAGVPNYYQNRTQDTAYLHSEGVKVGINKSYGGGINELYRFQPGRVENVIYEAGGGGLQISMYGYDPGGAHEDVAKSSGVCHGGLGLGELAPFNPVQMIGTNCAWDTPTNDVDPIAQYIDGNVVHVEKHGVGDFVKGALFAGLNIAQATWIGPSYAQINYHLTYSGPYSLFPHPQELPALFTARGINAVHFFYDGAQPYTHQPVSQALSAGLSGHCRKLPGRVPMIEGWDAACQAITEDWATTCDQSQTRCITVATFSPALKVFSMSYGTPPSTSGGVLFPAGDLAMTPGLDLYFTVYVFPYRYDEVVGGKSIRQWIYDLRP